MLDAIRSMLEQKPSEETWYALCGLLEEAEKPEIVEVDRILEEKGWPDGVRVAPSRWLESLLDGAPPFALRLVRILALSGEAADGELLRRLLRSPSLSGVCGISLSESEDGNGLLRALGGMRELGRIRYVSLFENGVKWKGLKALLDSTHRGRWEELTLRETLGEKGAEVLASSDLSGVRVLGLRGAGLDQRACEKLSTAPWIAEVERLDISENGLNDRAISSLFSGNWSKLSVLWAEDLGLRAGGVKALVEGLGACGSHLKELSLCGNPLGDKGLLHLLGSESLARLRVLRLAACGVGGGLDAIGRGGVLLDTLDLSENQLSEASVRSLVSSELRGANELLLDGHDWGEEGWRLLGGWDGLLEARFLGLDGGEMGDRGAQLLCQGDRLRGTRFLRIDGAGVGEEGLRACLSAMNTEELEGLALGGNPFGAGLGEIFCDVGNFSSLQELWLPGVGLTPSSLRSLGNVTFGNLRRLGLSSNEMNEEMVEALLEASWLGDIEELILRGVDLGDRGLALLAGSSAFKKLRVLDLAENPFGDRGLKALGLSGWAKGLRALDLSGNTWGPAGEDVLTALWEAGCEVEISEVDAWDEEAET